MSGLLEQQSPAAGRTDQPRVPAAHVFSTRLIMIIMMIMRITTIMIMMIIVILIILIMIILMIIVIRCCSGFAAVGAS